MRRGIVLLAVLLCTTAWAQRVVSARAGMIHYLEGRVSLDGKRIAQSPSRFRQMSNGQTLTTSPRARAELMLNPTTYLRVGESSAIKLLSDDLLDTRVELLTGAAIVDVRELGNGNRVTLEMGGSAIEFRKSGIYQLATETGGRVRVYEGEAFVGSLKISRGWQVILGAEPAKFDRKDTDSLYHWSEQRARVLGPVMVRPLRP